MAAMRGNSGWRPSMRTSKRPQIRLLDARPLAARPSSTSRSASAGRPVSACRNRRTSPRATPAPAFICAARPRGAAIRRSHSGRASATVRSRLPPSTTITSAPRARNPDRFCSVAAMPACFVQHRHDDREADRRSLRVRGLDRDSIQSEPADARDLQRRAPDVEPGDEAQEVDLDALDPAELRPEQAVEAELDPGVAAGQADQRSRRRGNRARPPRTASRCRARARRAAASP